jgi:hypothetical protein
MESAVDIGASLDTFLEKALRLLYLVEERLRWLQSCGLYHAAVLSLY